MLDLVLNNPFRVLGLPATATSRDITKRISDLEVFAELGKTRSYARDFLALGPLDRSVEAVRDAARKIEQPEGKLFHSFFWFRPGDVVDELAFECIESSDFEDAVKIWAKQIEKADEEPFTWRLNRWVLCLYLAIADESFDQEHFETALEDIGFVADDRLEETMSEVINDTSTVSPEVLRRSIVDVVVPLSADSDRPYGLNGIMLPDFCWSFSPDALDYLKAKVSNPLINLVQDAIDRSKSLREDGPSLDDLRRKNGLTRVEHIIYELQVALGDDNHRFQAIANSFADEVIACAVRAINKFQAVSTAVVLADWAAELPSFGQTSEWITKQKKAIYRWDSEHEDIDEEEEPAEEEESGKEEPEDAEELEEEETATEDLTPPEPEYNKLPRGTTTCPQCRKKFDPEDVRERLSFGVRCPHCCQAIVVW